MENKQSQREIVLNQLRTTGFITRNWCLQRYISRLSALILLLKNEGMNIEGTDLDNGDFIYRLKDKPKSTTIYRHPETGEVIHTKVVW